jgi:hypothetical protein
MTSFSNFTVLRWRTTVFVAFVLGLENAKVSLAPNPHNLFNLIISCGLESTAINIIKEA